MYAERGGEREKRKYVGRQGPYTATHGHPIYTHTHLESLAESNENKNKTKTNLPDIAEQLRQTAFASE